MAFVVGTSDQRLGFHSGRYIFINQDWLQKSNVLAPFGLDGPTPIQEGSPVEDYANMPATLFHEPTHSILLGKENERRKYSSVLRNSSH